MKLRLTRVWGESLKEKYPELFKTFNSEEEHVLHAVTKTPMNDFKVDVEIKSLNDLIKVLYCTNNSLVISEQEEDGVPYLDGIIYDDYME